MCVNIQLVVTAHIVHSGGPAGGGGEYTGGRTAGGDDIGYGKYSAEEQTQQRR